MIVTRDVSLDRSAATSSDHEPVQLQPPDDERSETHGLRGRPILLATDFSRAAWAATHVAGALGAQRGAAPRVLHVLDTRGRALPAALVRAVAVGAMPVGAAAREAQQREIRAWIERSLGESIAWPARVAAGKPAREIAAEAERTGASLIVMGMGRHSRAERMAGADTALDVIRTSRVPVLGATRSLVALPRTAVVGVRLGRAASVTTARAALEVLASGGRLVLTHVRVPTARPGGIGERDACSALHRLIAELDAPAGIVVEPLVLDAAAGATVADVLLDVADRLAAELVVAGTDRTGPWARFVVGDVPADLVHDGRCAVLVVPRLPAPGPAGIRGTRERR